MREHLLSLEASLLRADLCITEHDLPAAEANVLEALARTQRLLQLYSPGNSSNNASVVEDTCAAMNLPD